VKQRCVFKQFIAINDNLEVDARVFISYNQNGEESKIVERQRECVSDRASLKVKDSVSHKTGQLDETFCDGHMQLISESLQMLLMTCFPRFIFYLEFSR
jgi:hypothetical protein